MGCLCARHFDKESQIEVNSKKVYSWDLRNELNTQGQNYKIERLSNEERVEVPGSVNGNQFLIRDCKDSSIYILDHMNTVTIDDCVNCKIILGPVKGSVYVRDCTNCICVIACGQLRIRDCRKIMTFVHCETQPVIEASTAISFGSYQLKYKNIEQHFLNSALDIRKKNWDTIFDFTPLETEINWKIIETEKAYNHVKDPVSHDITEKLKQYEQTWCFEEDIKCTTNSNCSTISSLV